MPWIIIFHITTEWFVNDFHPFCITEHRSNHLETYLGMTVTHTKKEIMYVCHHISQLNCNTEKWLGCEGKFNFIGSLLAQLPSHRHGMQSYGKGINNWWVIRPAFSVVITYCLKSHVLAFRKHFHVPKLLYLTAMTWVSSSRSHPGASVAGCKPPRARDNNISTSVSLCRLGL